MKIYSLTLLGRTNAVNTAIFPTLLYKLKTVAQNSNILLHNLEKTILKFIYNQKTPIIEGAILGDKNSV